MIRGKTVAFLCLMSPLLAISPQAINAADHLQPSTTEKVIRDTKEAVESTTQYTMQQKDTFQKAVQAELAEMQTKIAELRKQTNAAAVEARAEMQKALQELERNKEEARKQLDEVTQSTNSAWSKLKDNMNAAVADLKKSYKEIVSKLP